MRTWRSIGYLWILLAWFMVSSPPAYAENRATVRGFHPSSAKRWNTSVPPQDEALAARTGIPDIARLARERTSGSGDYTPPLDSLLSSPFTTHCLEAGAVRLYSFWTVATPQKAGRGFKASRAPPFLD